MNPKRCILLTGGTGFLGSHLLRRFLEEGHRLILLKRSTSSIDRIREQIAALQVYDIDLSGMDAAFKENKIDIVVHCATNYGRDGATVPEVVEANLMLPLRLLNLAASHGVRAFINSDTILQNSVNPYSLSKHQFGQWFTQYAGKLACINLPLEHFYGPRDDRSKFVTKMILQLLRGVPSIALTPGRQRRDFIYIDDVVDAFSRVIEFASSSPGGFHSFHVGTGKAFTIRDFLEQMKLLSGNTATQLDFGALPYRENETMNSCEDISAISSLGWAPRVSLQQGLEQTIEQERSLPA